MFLTSRSYADEEDLRAMQDLLSTSWLTERPFVGATAGDLALWRWMHEEEGWEDLIQLWHDPTGAPDHAGLVGWAWFQPPAGLYWHVRADLRSGSLPGAMFRWLDGKARWWAARTETAPSERVSAWSIDADELAGRALRDVGFVPGEPDLHHHVRSLRNGDSPLPEPAVPFGYTIRHVRGEDDIAARVALHRVVWAPSKLTEASHRAVMRQYPYRPDLDIVVEAPDGTFAAYALGWFDPLGLVGELEPVGTHPDHRRAGLARAACLAVIHRFLEIGAETALVYSTATASESGELAAHDLYASMGLQVVTIHRPWWRSWRAEAGPD